MAFVWVLNPDAERELAAKHSYAIKAALVAQLKLRRRAFDALLLGEPSYFSHELPQAAGPAQALLWCPTPYSTARVKARGFQLAAGPAVEVLRRVHNKRFLSERLSQWALPGRSVVETEAQWRTVLAETSGCLRLKRLFGYAGKGQRVWPRNGTRDDQRWVEDSLRQGGLVAEPNVGDAVEVSLHGYVDGRGELRGAPCLQTTDPRGVPLSVQPMTVVDKQATDTSQLEALLAAVTAELREAGYFGPFGFDVLVLPRGPRIIDLNPRFTLGWSTGMGTEREAALQRALTPVPY